MLSAYGFNIPQSDGKQLSNVEKYEDWVSQPEWVLTICSCFADIKEGYVNYIKKKTQCYQVHDVSKGGRACIPHLNITHLPDIYQLRLLSLI